MTGPDADMIISRYTIFPTGWSASAARLDDQWSVTVDRFNDGSWLIRRGTLHWSPAANDGAGGWVTTTFYGKSPDPTSWFNLADARALARHLADTSTGRRGLTFAQTAAKNT